METEQKPKSFIDSIIKSLKIAVIGEVGVELTPAGAKELLAILTDPGIEITKIKAWKDLPGEYVYWGTDKSIEIALLGFIARFKTPCQKIYIMPGSNYLYMVTREQN